MILTTLSAIVLAGTSPQPGSSIQPSTEGEKKHAKDIVSTAIEAGSFKSLVAALQSADLAATLQTEGPFTVFAPTEAAFQSIPKDDLKALFRPEGRELLTSILTYHVIPGRLHAEDVLKAPNLTTLNGQRVDVLASTLQVNEANIVQADIECANGVIHVIDSVLLPQTDNIVDTAKELGTFQTLLTAATQAGLANTLAQEGPFTVLAPTDEAFAALPKETLKALLRPQNKKVLANTLKLHVLPGRVFADQALRTGNAPALTGEGLRFSLTNGRLSVNGANVLANDVTASNGVIHAIDKVLLPKAGIQLAPEGRLVLGVYTETPSKALASQLGIDRHKSLILTSIVKSSSAREAGLKKYDVIVSIDNRPATEKNLREAKSRAGAGGTLQLVLYREGKRLTENVSVGIDTH